MPFRRTARPQPLPCADVLTATVHEIISSLRVLGLPEGTARAFEAVASAAISAADRGNLPAALGILGALENRIEALVRSDRMDPVTGDTLIGLVEQARAVLASCTATPPLVAFNCRSGSVENELLWLSPPGSFASTTILYREDRFPLGPNDPAASVLGVFTGGPDEVGRATHDFLTNGVRYYYAAFADDGSGELSPARLTFGRPERTDGSFRWAYTAGGTGRPSVSLSSDVLATSSSTGFVFGLEVGTDGGRWTQDWNPARVPAPAPARTVGIPAIAPLGIPAVFVASLEGRVTALDGRTGETLWVSPPLGGELTSSPCAMFRAFGGVDDVVMIGTANRRSGNRFYGLRVTDGTVAWSFDNGGGRDSVGRMFTMCNVNYNYQRVYFTSESLRSGSQDTLWALSLETGTVTPLWSARIDGVNTSVVRRNGVIYVGTETGEVHAIDQGNGAALWGAPYSTGDGPVKTLVWPVSGGSDKLAFSTSRQVHLIRDEGATASSVWNDPVTLVDPNSPIYWDERVLVTDAGGRYYELDGNAAQPVVVPVATFGDPTRLARPGLPLYYRTDRTYTVGTNEGVVYTIERPQ